MFNMKLICVAMLSFSAVFAAVPNEVHLDLKVRSEDKVASEQIDINYRENYVKISNLGHQQEQPVSVMHDYNQGINALKKGDHCFVMDKFDALPENIKDWETIQSDIANDTEREVTEYKVFNYKPLDFSADRSTLPEAIQRFCTGSIHILVLDGEETRAEMGDNKGSEIFIPGYVARSSRAKRAVGLGTLFGIIGTVFSVVGYFLG